MIQKQLILIFATLMALLCVAQGVSAPPSWYVEVPKDSSFLYGNGSGKTLEESKKNAINDLASSIKLNVSSNTSILNTQDNENQESKLLQNINVSIGNIELQNIIVTHTKYQDNQYYSQVKISKSVLIKSLKDDYKSVYAELENLKPKNCQSISIKDRNTFEDLLDKASSLSQSIQALDFASNLPSLAEYEKIFHQNSPLVKAKLIFSSNSDKDGIRTLSSEYAKFIQNTDEPNVGTIDNDITIKAENDKTQAFLSANIKDCSGKTILYIKLEGEGRTKDDALDRIKVQLFKKLKEYGQDDIDTIPRIF